MSYDINGVGGINGGQDVSAPPSGQASNADIGMFEQQIEALLQQMQARDAASGGGNTQPAAGQAPGGYAQGGGGTTPFGGASGGQPPNADASQPMTAGATGGQGQNTVQILEQVAEALLQALEGQNGGQGAGGGGTGGGAPAGGTTGGGMPGTGEAGAPGGEASAGAASQAAAQGAAPTFPDGAASGGSGATGEGTSGSTQQASATAGGGTMSVDGAKPGGDTVAMQVVNNTGKDEKVALTNSQNQTFADVDLKAGQKETLLLDPDDPNTKSARMQTTNPDGSLRQDAKLTEFNLQPGHTAINVSNNNFAGITGTDGHAVDAEQMQINDNQGKVVGDGAANGAYRNSVDDANAMIMGDDPSKNYTVTIS